MRRLHIWNPPESDDQYLGRDAPSSASSSCNWALRRSAFLQSRLRLLRGLLSELGQPFFYKTIVHFWPGNLMWISLMMTRSKLAPGIIIWMKLVVLFVTPLRCRKGSAWLVCGRQLT